MIARSVSYGELYQLLAGLDFVNVSDEPRWKAYRHGGTEVMILLANREEAVPARPAYLISVRRHLLDNGVLNQGEFERLLS